MARAPSRHKSLTSRLHVREQQQQSGPFDPLRRVAARKHATVQTNADGRRAFQMTLPQKAVYHPIFSTPPIPVRNHIEGILKEDLLRAILSVRECRIRCLKNAKQTTFKVLPVTHRVRSKTSPIPRAVARTASEQNLGQHQRDAKLHSRKKD